MTISPFTFIEIEGDETAKISLLIKIIQYNYQAHKLCNVFSIFIDPSESNFQFFGGSMIPDPQKTSTINTRI